MTPTYFYVTVRKPSDRDVGEISEGWFVLEDQFLITDSGREALHRTATPDLPVIPA